MGFGVGSDLRDGFVVCWVVMNRSKNFADGFVGIFSNDAAKGQR